MSIVFKTKEFSNLMFHLEFITFLHMELRFSRWRWNHRRLEWQFLPLCSFSVDFHII